MLIPKKCFLALVAAGVIAIGASFATAQDNQPAPPASDQQAPPEHGGGHHGMPDPAEHAQMLAKHLNLSADQQAKAQSIFETQRTQMESLRNDTSLSQQDRHTRMMDIHTNTASQIRGILNSDQQKKWDEMQARHEQMGGHKHGGPGDQQGPPPQQ